mgnify:CR=1 FL=1|tara:strand:- start:33668 stop:35221 length:1554 start_codon:yes stop_codon:yes gene_type:complete
MIVVFHENNKVVQIYDYSNNQEIDIALDAIQETLVLLAIKNTSQFIGWCHESLKEDLNLTKWNSILKHPLLLVSFETSDHFYMTSDIGYIEDTPFINVNKNVSYPTWFMSSDVGVIHASVLLKFEYLLKYKLAFDLFLNMIAKVGMKQGLLCYSNPNLLIDASKKRVITKKNISSTNFLWFVKSNYRYRWILLYLLNLSIHNKKFLIFPFLRVLFKKSIKNKISFDNIKLKEYKKLIGPSIDVLIPTLGREKYLKDVLLDLANQTILPKKVIIIEQNPIENELSKLDFLNEPWPFEIDHTIIYQLGACNARNIGLSKVSSDWVFFADDDVRFNSTLLEDGFKYLNLYQTVAICLSCLQKNEIENHNNVFQSATFGSGTSIVKSTALKDVKFDRAYEFGYGEDADFGMQLRNTGTDILYVPFVKILHLKALIGGFRKKMIRKWEKEAILPKPSPTIMVYKLKYATKEQLQSYKTTLFLKFYKNQPIINPLSYYKQFQKALDKSKYWATNLINKESNEI